MTLKDIFVKTVFKVDLLLGQPLYRKIDQIIITALEKSREGAVSLEEARFLYHYAVKSDVSRPIIEIGTHFGTSTLAICMGKAVTQELITVDNFSWNALHLPPNEHYELVKKILKEVIDNESVSIVCKDKDAFYAGYEGATPSMVFLDANHDYEPTRRDLEWALGVKADVICVHDYCDSFPGVMQAVNELGGVAKLHHRIAVLNK